MDETDVLEAEQRKSSRLAAGVWERTYSQYALILCFPSVWVVPGPGGGGGVKRDARVRGGSEEAESCKHLTRAVLLAPKY